MITITLFITLINSSYYIPNTLLRPELFISNPLYSFLKIYTFVMFLFYSVLVPIYLLAFPTSPTLRAWSSAVSILA